VVQDFTPPPPPPPPPVQTQSYTVKKGDTLAGIAARYGLNYRDLVDLNQLTDPDKIYAGQTLDLPADAKPVAAPKRSMPSKPSAAAPAQNGGSGVYVVRSGDTLSQIASRHGVKLADLKAVNGLAGDRILVGQKLVLPDGAQKPQAAAPAPKAKKPEPAKAPAAPAPKPPAPAAKTEAPTVKERAPEPAVEESSAARVTEYIVYPDDKLEDIAALYETTVKKLMEINNFTGEVELREGQRILVPVNH
jgi:LysM repeat protein